jgi:hypothetical protein
VAAAGAAVRPVAAAALVGAAVLQELIPVGVADADVAAAANAHQELQKIVVMPYPPGVVVGDGDEVGVHARTQREGVWILGRYVEDIVLQTVEVQQQQHNALRLFPHVNEDLLSFQAL